MASVDAVGLKLPPDGEAAAPTPKTPSSVQPKDTVHPDAKDIWIESLEAMGREQRDLFVAEMPHGDLLEYATTLERMMADMSDSSHTLKVAKRIAPLIQLFEVTQPFSDALHAVYPPAGMIIGGISFLLSASKRAVDYQEALNSFLESTVDLLAILEGFKSAIRLTKEAQIALAKVYGEIAQFVAQLSKLFMKRHSRHGLRIFARSQLNDFDADFQGVKQKMKTHVDNFQMAATFQSQVDSKKSHGKTHEKLDSMERDWKAQDARRQGLTASKYCPGLRLLFFTAGTRQDMLSWISRDDSYYRAHDQKLGERLESTGNWLLSHKLFQAWKQAEKSQLLWIHGKAGSGKSHLAACVIDALEKGCKTHRQSGDKGTHALAYFYCSAKSTQQQDQRGDASSSTSQLAVLLLSSILRQLYEQLSAGEDVDSILQNYKDRPNIRLGSEKTKDGIRNTLAKFIRAFIVIDGLDEWSELEDFAKLCSFLQSLTTLDSKSIISVVIFSRPKQPILESTLSESVKVAVDDGSNADDINLFINKRTGELMKASPASERIKTEIASRAGGTFLWASLVINDMKSKRTPKQMQQALEKTPSGLRAAYSTSLQRIMAQEESRRDLGLNALLWVSNSLEPLTERELVEALSFQPGMKSIDNDDRVYGDMIISDCADLLIVRQGRYELLHSSLKDYLKSGPSDSSPPEEVRKMQSQANALLGRRCLEYLQLDEFQEAPVDTAEDFDQKLQTYPLLKHAAMYWGDYLRQSYSTENPGDCSFECRSLQNPTTRNFATQIRRAFFGWDKKTLFPCPGKVQPLHLIARFGLERLLAQFPEAASQIDVVDGFGLYPIDYTYEKTMFEWILDNRGVAQQSVDGENNTGRIHNTPWYEEPPIIMAARNNWDDLVLRLIEEGSDKDERQEDAQTALHAAALAGSFASAKVLIEAGADINSTDGVGDTPLMNTVLENHLSLFNLLLENGADPELPCSKGRTVLHQLAFKEEEEWISLIPLLRAHGANLETTGEIRLTPLLMAAHADNAGALQAFLDQGANISATDAFDGNILHICAKFGKSRAMDFLLKYPRLRATLDELAQGKDRWGLSPLHRAIEYGPLRMAGALLSSGLPSLDFEDAGGWWPVHFAAKRGALQVVRALVDLDAENASRKTSDLGFTPLHLAAEAGYTRLVEYLLSTGTDINLLCTTYGHTPLLKAIIGQQTATALMLLSHGADPCLPNHYGDAALEHAAMYGNEVLIQWLLDSVSNYPISHDRRLRALNDAVENQHVEVVDLLLLPPVDSGFLCAIEKSLCGINAIRGGSIEIWQSLVTTCPPLLHAIGEARENWLHHAAERGHTQLIGHLCKEGLDPEMEDNCGQTPLFWAARSGSTGALRALCRKGVNLSHRDHFGRTALHWAVTFRCSNSVEILLRQGADPFARDQAGFFAFEYLGGAQLASIAGQHATNPSPPSDTQQNRPQEAITSIARRCLQLDFPDTTGQQSNCITVLRHILVKLRAFKEALLTARESSTSAVSCTMCKDTLEGPWSHCKECNDTGVCSSCRTSFFTKAGISRLPRNFNGIQIQEMKLRSVREALFHAINLGATTVSEVLETHKAFAAMFTRLFNLHQAWQTGHGLEHVLFRSKDVPGWNLIYHLEDLRVHQADMQIDLGNDDPETTSDRIPSLVNMATIRYRLRRLFIDHPPGQEFRDFRCTGHEYLDVPTVEELPEEEKAFFDEEGNPTASFFRMIETKYSAGEAPEPPTTVDSSLGDSQTSTVEATFSSPQEPNPDSSGGEPEDDSSVVFEDAREEQPRHSQQVAGEDSEGSSDDDASSDISASTEVGEELLIFEDREPGRIWRDCNPDFDFDQFRDTLLERMKALGPGDGGREMLRKKAVLETAWALAQAFAFEDTAHFPTLAEYLD